MKERIKDWVETLVIVCIYLFMGMLGNKLGMIDEGIILPLTIGGTTGYLISRDMKRNK